VNLSVSGFETGVLRGSVWLELTARDRAMEDPEGSSQQLSGPSAVLKARKTKGVDAGAQPKAVSPVKAWDSDASSVSAESENDPVAATVVPFDPVPPPRPLSVRSRAPDDGTASTSGKENEKEKELRVCSVTWNMCGRKFPSNLEPMLAPLFGRGDDGDIVRGWSAADDDEDGIDTPCDILVVGVQEAPAMDGFVEGLLAALGGDDEFVHLAGVSLEPGGWIQMEVFLRRELLPFVSDVRRDAVSCGIGNVFGNKGSVGVAFTCAGAKLCFLNAHLAAHTEKVKQRNADYHRIVRTMFAPRGGGKNGKSSSSNMARRPKAKANAVAPADAPDETGALKPQTPIDPQRPTPETPSLFKGLLKRRAWTAADGFDMCVFMGDLNYRVEGNRRAVDVLLENRMMDVMLANDQLAIEKAAGRVFSGWSEADLKFPPTYKLNRGTADVYDTSAKQRVPSWTDRVLWRTKAGGKVRCNDGADVYTSAKGIRTSDHLPVVARIKTTIHDATLAAIQRGGHLNTGSRSRLCSVM